VSAKIKLPKKLSALKVPKLKRPKSKIFKPIFSIGGYFKGSWVELRQVFWPNRRATWGLTLAVILFTAIFIGLIICLDWIFTQLFNVII